MKKINVYAWFITMLMTMMASPAYADWDSKDVTMEEGEIQTLYLPSTVTSKKLKSVTFYSASWNNVEVLSYNNYSVRVKALKAYSTPVIVRCDYYYYVSSGNYTYQASGAYDFKITVNGKKANKPTKISLPSVVAVEVGESKDIDVTVTPSNAEYTLTWAISDKSIATFNQNGTITGKSVGDTDLKVTADNGVYAMCRISVYQPKPSSVVLPSMTSLKVGDTYTLKPDVYPANAKYTLTWSSRNSSVASVSSSGLVTAKSAGTATITVKTDNGKTATCKVTVTEKTVAATSVSIKSTLSLTEGETYTLTPTVTPSDAKTSYTWSFSNSSVASVSSSGLVTAKSAGTTTITVKTDNGKSATCKVTVTTKAVKEYKITFSIYGYENGKVLFNGKQLTGEILEEYGAFKVTEGSDVALTILPNEGYVVDWLWLDWEDVKEQMVKDVLTISNVKEDLFLTVSFEPDESILSTITPTSESENKPVVIYDLNGRRVDASKAIGGIFIVNGKKVYIR